MSIEQLRAEAMQLTKLDAANLIVKLQNERDFFKKKMDVAVDLEQTNQIVKLQHENKRLKEVAEQSQDGINALFLLECIDHVYDSLGLNADFPIWQERVKAVSEFDFKDLHGARKRALDDAIAVIQVKIDSLNAIESSLGGAFPLTKKALYTRQGWKTARKALEKLQHDG